jgi:hypothetical protein
MGLLDSNSVPLAEKVTLLAEVISSWGFSVVSSHRAAAFKV